MQTSKRIVTALVSIGMVTAMGQSLLQAQTHPAPSATEASASAPIDATTSTTEATASAPTDTAKSITQSTAPASTGTTTSTTQPTVSASTDTSTSDFRATVLGSEQSDMGVEFQKGEFNISPFGTYVDQAGGRWGAGVAGTWFLTDKIGIGGATYWTDTSGTFFDNVEFEGYFRWPFKRVAPYAVASIGYQFDHTYWFETLGGGIDFRAFKRLDAFSDLQWRIANSDKSGNGALLRFGLRFNLK
jgi:hypothetical protein